MLKIVLLAVLGVIAFVVLGSVLLAVLKVAIGLLFYVFAAALLVGGIVFVVNRVRNSLDR